MTRRTALAVTAATGVVAATLVAGAGIAWPELACSWNLARLRREPGLFKAMYLMSTSNAQRAAAERFLREDRGREELIRTFFSLHGGVSAFSGTPPFPEGGGVIVTAGRRTIYRWVGGGGRNITPQLGLHSLHWIDELLKAFPFVSGRTVRLPDLPELEFQPFAVTDGKVGSPRWPDGTGSEEVETAVVDLSLAVLGAMSAEKGSRGVIYFRRRLASPAPAPP